MAHRPQQLDPESLQEALEDLKGSPALRLLRNFLEERLEECHLRFETSSDLPELYRTQGEARAFRKLLDALPLAKFSP